MAGQLVLKLVDLMGNRYDIEDAYFRASRMTRINASAQKIMIIWIVKNRNVIFIHVVSIS